jgi:uncharacterized protein (DUF934 family)
MALIKDGAAVSDPFFNAAGQVVIPAAGPVIVSLEQWLAHLSALFARRSPIGIRLRSDQHPEVIADDLDHFAVIALEVPAFRDGRPYSYARLLRERWGYRGELRAVGDVLPDQLHFMHRAGFNAFELQGADPVQEWAAAAAEFSVWYQATGDGRLPARLLRIPPWAAGDRSG